jgi:hypothetical protein
MSENDVGTGEFIFNVAADSLVVFVWYLPP